MPVAKDNISLRRGGTPKCFAVGSSNNDEALHLRLSRHLGIPAVVSGTDSVALLNNYANRGVMLTFEEADEVIKRVSLDRSTDHVPASIKALLDSSVSHRETGLRIDLNMQLNARWTNNLTKYCSRWFRQPLKEVEWTIHLHAGAAPFAWGDYFAALNRLKSGIRDVVAEGNMPRPRLAVYGWPESGSVADMEKFVSTGTVLHPLFTSETIGRISVGRPDRTLLKTLADFGLRLPIIFLIESTDTAALLPALRDCQTITKVSGFSLIAAAAWPYSEQLLGRTPKPPTDYDGLISAVDADGYLSELLLDPVEDLNMRVRQARRLRFRSIILDKEGRPRLFRLVPSVMPLRQGRNVKPRVRSECKRCVLRSICGECDSNADSRVFHSLCIMRSRFILQTITDCLELTSALPSHHDLMA